MSPLQDQNLSVGSTPTPRTVRAVNASLASIRKGLTPILQDRAGDYFRFANGQVRRQIGCGHSREERQQRRAQKQKRRWVNIRLRSEQAVLEMYRQRVALAADKAALSLA